MLFPPARLARRIDRPDLWLQSEVRGFNAADPNLHRYVGNSPTNRVDPSGLDWAAAQAAEYLVKTPSGRETLKYLRKNKDKIRVWKSEYIKAPWKKKTDTKWSFYTLYGNTQWGAYKVGVADITISSKMDALTAAASLVHEVYHARKYITEGHGGTEAEARIHDLQFYCDLGKEGIKALPKEYKGFLDDGTIKENRDGTFTLNVRKLRKEAKSLEKRFGRSRAYDYGEYDFGKWWRQIPIDDFLPKKKTGLASPVPGLHSVAASE
jgi:hypothetical protein